MEAAREEFVPAVDSRLLRLVHQDKFLHQTQAAGVVARLQGGGARQDPPLNVGLDPLVLEGPDVSGEFGLDPLLRVLEVRLYVYIYVGTELLNLQMYLYHRLSDDCSSQVVVSMTGKPRPLSQ